MAARPQSDLGNEAPSAYRCKLGGFLHTQEPGILLKGLCPPAILQDSGKPAAPGD